MVPVIFFLVWAFLFVFLVCGWVMNIISLVAMDWAAPLGIEAILRVVGIILAPLGAVMGWFV